MSLTEKQKAARENAIGSSDAPVVAGVSSYSSPLELFYKLRGDLPRYDENETWEQKVGSKLEPVIAELVAEELGIKIRRCPPRIHPRYPFMTANLDYEILNNPKGCGILEVKRRQCAPFDTLPDDIVLQVAHQMAVTNRDWGKVAVQFTWGKPKVFEVERDKELEEYLIELEHRFILRVEKGEPPTEDWTPATVGLLKKLYPLDSGKTIELPADFAVNAAGFLQAKAEIDAAEARKATYEGLIKSAMEDASVAVIPGWGEFTWRTSRAGQKFDLEQFQKDHPDLYQQYLKPVPGSRRFLPKPKKESSCPTKSQLENRPQRTSLAAATVPLSSP